MNKYLMEFIGTFFLVLTVGCTVILGGGTIFAPIAIGAALMIMVYAGGNVSGGHYNPAVSLAAYVRGALEGKHIIQYWIAQILGAGVAALIVMQFVQTLNPVQENTFNLVNLFIAELLFTFALAFVVLASATSITSEGNSYYGLAIGATVTVGAFAVGSICPAAFNPAVAFAVGLLQLVMWKTVVITIIANLFGGLFAAWAFKLTYKSEV